MPYTDIGTRMRIVLLIRSLAETPQMYTIRQLAQRFEVSPDTIKGDLEVLRNAGYVVDYDQKYRYFFKIEKPFTHLKDRANAYCLVRPLTGGWSLIKSNNYFSEMDTFSITPSHIIEYLYCHKELPVGLTFSQEIYEMYCKIQEKQVL